MECRLLILISEDASSKVSVRLRGELVRQGAGTFDYLQPMEFKKKPSYSSSMFIYVDKIFDDYQKIYL